MRQTALVRHLRLEQTPAEARLWTLVRGRRLANAKFRRQVPIDRFVADFVCVEARLIIEIDGRVHDDEAAQLKDIERTAILEACGYLLIRFSNSQVLNAPGEVSDSIIATLRAAHL
jgi:very-short-patch-repair endonuclease